MRIQDLTGVHLKFEDFSFLIFLMPSFCLIVFACLNGSQIVGESPLCFLGFFFKFHY